MQDPGYRLPRKYLLGTSVNKGKEEGRLVRPALVATRLGRNAPHIAEVRSATVP